MHLFHRCETTPILFCQEFFTLNNLSSRTRKATKKVSLPFFFLLSVDLKTNSAQTLYTVL